MGLIRVDMLSSAAVQVPYITQNNTPANIFQVDFVSKTSTTNRVALGHKVIKTFPYASLGTRILCVVEKISLEHCVRGGAIVRVRRYCCRSKGGMFVDSKYGWSDCLAVGRQSCIVHVLDERTREEWTLRCSHSKEKYS